VQYALYRASGLSTACLDWNNNYGDDPDKCILFHCGSTAQSLMKGKGNVVDHSMLQHDPQVGPNCSFGCNEGRIAEFPFGFGSMTTRNGKLEFYLGEGEFTSDTIPDDFFGCGGVAKIENLQDVLLYVGKNGHRHHMSVTPGKRMVGPIKEALDYYLGYNVSIPQIGGK
jgi:L-fucose isomerase-like protein